MEQRYNSQICDEQIRQFWKQQQIYRHQEPNFVPFTIDTPPPTISGSLHIGHIFSYTQTDITARYKRMTGHNVFYPFGFDCNGLATERFVEKKHNTNVYKLGREKFIELCLSTTEEMKQKFVNLWQTLGLSAELEDTYSTIAPNVRKLSQESFLDLIEKNYIYRKNEPALYCTVCRTTVAQAELDDIEQATTFNQISFTTTDGQTFVIATTRPELLPSCVAVMYHPDDARFAHLHGKTAIVPIFGQAVPLIADSMVLPDKGTGIVMTCTFGDKTDIEWYKKHNLAHRQSIGFDGKFVASTGILAGLNVSQARQTILEKLKEENFLLAQTSLNHAVGVHERCKNPIEYTILPQWFIRVVEHRDTFIKLGDQINWYPAHMKSRYIDWVKNLSWDWCISRQRVFGIPFPVWYCNSCDHAIFADKKQLPVDPQVDSAPSACTKCGSTDLRPEKDVMDTWNTSAITPFICKELAQKNNNPFSDTSFIPMSMRPHAHDIIRTWTFYTIVKTWMHQQTIPWNELIISGYVLSENKEKISKSKNNAPTEPEKLLTLYPADAIRFWTASGTLGQDIAFSPEQMNIGQKLLTKLWNALKFVQINTAGQSIDMSMQPELDTTNRWMLDRIQQTLDSYHAYHGKKEFSLALQAVETTFWQDFCDNYVEIVKDQFFNPQNYSDAQIYATRWTLLETSFRLLQMYSPYLPHITEYLYQHILQSFYQTRSIHLSQIPRGKEIDESAANAMQIMLQIIGAVRKLKTTAELSLRTELATLTICNITPEQKALIQNEIVLLQGVCKTKEITFISEHKPSGLVQENELWFAAINVEQQA